MTRNAARTDANHAEIRDGLRACGYDVRDESKRGAGYPDLAVKSKRGVVVYLEVKSPGGRLTTAELDWWLWYDPPGGVVYSLDGALEMVLEWD